jgi:hypothetical protein
VLVLEVQEAIGAGQTYWEIAGKGFGINVKSISRDPQICVTDLGLQPDDGGRLFQVTDMTESMTHGHEISNRPSNFRDAGFRRGMNQDALNRLYLC